MTYHRCDDEAEPEKPERVTAICDALERTGLAAECVRIPSRFATEAEILALHSPGYVEFMETTSRMTPRQCQGVVKKYDNDVFVNASTWMAARLALGCAVEATAHCIAGLARHAMAVVRPPGHHACADKASGFCFLNTVATCAKLATRGELTVQSSTPTRPIEGGAADGPSSSAATTTTTPGGAPLPKLDRVMICDFDVHHGDGTQGHTYDDEKILYVSAHRAYESKQRWKKRLFYPGTGRAGETGRDGTNVNVGWSEAGVGDAEYELCWERLVVPIARAFKPQLILFSAGFDAARGDPLGECDVTPACYGRLVEPLAALAPCVLCLEGGYNLDVIGECFCACAEVLLGRPPVPAPPRPPVQASAATDIFETVAAHLRHWPAGVLRVMDDDVQDRLVDTLQAVGLEASGVALSKPKRKVRKPPKMGGPDADVLVGDDELVWSVKQHRPPKKEKQPSVKARDAPPAALVKEELAKLGERPSVVPCHKPGGGLASSSRRVWPTIRPHHVVHPALKTYLHPGPFLCYPPPPQDDRLGAATTTPLPADDDDFGGLFDAEDEATAVSTLEGLKYDRDARDALLSLASPRVPPAHA